MKSIWSGSISFGLVKILIKLYAAIEPHTPGFTLLCTQCLSPISYERWCRKCHTQVSWQDTVKGLKQSDGSYFVISQENLKKLKPETTDNITINQCVPMTEILPLYLDAHYYIAPDKKNEKEYFLFQKALIDAGLVAIGTFVMHEKEHVAAIMPYGKGLLLNTLNYAYEIKDINKIPQLTSAPKISKQEQSLAQLLIKQLTKKKFDLSRYHDSFKEKLEKAIKESKKAKPQKKTLKKKRMPAKRKPSSTLITALRGSLKKPLGQPVARAKKR